MKKIDQISKKTNNKNSYYRIAVKYDCPYIAQRNGGNREVDSHLSLKCAQQRLLEMFNERFDEGYAKNWGIAVISSKNKGYIQAFATDPDGMRSFYFDSRTFYIEKMSFAEEKEEKDE